MNDRHRKIAKMKNREKLAKAKKFDSISIREALDKTRKEFLAIIEAWNKSRNKAIRGLKNGAKADKD